MKNLVTSIFLIIFTVHGFSQNKLPEYSSAGFYPEENSGREVFNFNVGWRFLKAEAQGASADDFDDSDWEVVNLPHGLEFLPTQASGGVNYQGPAWYRKHFTLPESLKGKKLTLHFEAIMGKSKVYLNGKLVQEQFGGFLPFEVELEKYLEWGKENVIAVWADNSDDPDYPPGKSQKTMDFSYFGGIYRDVWLVSTNTVFVSNPNAVDKISGGGVFVHFDNVSGNKADVIVEVDVQNSDKLNKDIHLEVQLIDKKGDIVVGKISNSTIKGFNSKALQQKLKVKNAQLWTPDTPYLYDLKILIKNRHGKIIDGLRKRIGIRKIEFKGKEGFYLNGELYHDKLIGANRHQDFGYVGNALPNSGHWRDVKKLRDAGMRIIRSAHYPQDPAFMDACDALGMFVIVTTPGWQFWNDKPIFEKRVYKDIRNMVRRDRNHPSVIMWEPILNETRYPDYFAKKVHDIVHEEYPWQGAYTACDSHAKGHEYFDVTYNHPVGGKLWTSTVEPTKENYTNSLVDYSNFEKSVFTREWGDNVDDWDSHNSTSRVSRGWGEQAQLTQALHYAGTNIAFTSLEGLYMTPNQHVGGTFWHAFDHQRGYHPDTFYGGVMDVFRQPKYSYYLFMSQRDPNLELENADSGPMIYTAHEMSPFSTKDITVFTNCEEVRLILMEKDTLIQRVAKENHFMRHPPVVFKDAYDFMDLKKLQRQGKKKQANIVVEGLINGKVVCSEIKRPSKRPTKLKIEIDHENIPLVANGSDFVPLVVSLTDDLGIVKRLNNYSVRFEVEGEGRILGDQLSGANPVNLEWGTAPVLIQSTNVAGEITVKAFLRWEGINTPVSDEFTFESIPSKKKMIFKELPRKVQLNFPDSHENQVKNKDLQREIQKLKQQINRFQLEEVSKQQEEFEKKGN